MIDWRSCIDAIRSDVRKARSEGLKETSLDNLGALLDNLSSFYEDREHKEIQKEAEKKQSDYDSVVRHYEHFLAYNFTKTSEYVRLIIAGAYIAFFTVWVKCDTIVKSDLYLWSAMCVGFSVFVFILWETFANIYLASNIRYEANLFRKNYDEYVKLKAEQQTDERKRKINLVNSWYFILIVILICGISGYLLLSFGVLMHLFTGHGTDGV